MPRRPTRCSIRSGISVNASSLSQAADRARTDQRLNGAERLLADHLEGCLAGR